MKDIYLKTINSMKSKINQGRMFFVKGNQGYAFSKEEIDSIFLQNNSIESCYYRYDTKIIQPIFCPLLDWIKRIYDEKYKERFSIEEFIEECDIYKLQKPAFISYFNTGKAQRPERIIFGEVRYEQKRYIQSIINILKYITKENKLFLILDGLQYSNTSILTVLQSLIDEGGMKNFALLVYYNDNCSVLEYMKDEFDKLLNELEVKDMVVDYCNILNDEEEVVRSEVKCKDCVYDADYIEEILLNIHNMIIMLNISQSVYYSQLLYDNITHKKIQLEKNHITKAIIHLITARTYQRYRSNLMIVNKMDFYFEKFLCSELKNYISDDKDILNFTYNYIMCILTNIENQKDEAFEYYINCKEYANLVEDDNLDFNADMAYYFMLCYDKTILSRRKEKTTYIEEELTKELERRKQYNILQYMYMYNYECDDESIEEIEYGKRDFVYLEKAIEYAKFNNNTYFMERAYGRKNIYFNNNKINDILFKKDINMQKYLHLEIANPKYSFMAYRYTMTEEFELSHKTNNELLVKMYNNLLVEGVAENYTTENNIVEFLLAVYNMGVNCMCARQFKYASEYLLIAIKEMEMLNSYDLSMCDLAKLYGMVAYCYYEMEMDYKCALYTYKLKGLIDYGFKYEEAIIEGTSTKVRRDSLFLYCVTDGLTNLKVGNIERAKDQIEKAFNYFAVEEGQWPFMFPIIAVAQYKLYSTIGEEEKAKEMVRKCYDFAIEYELFTVRDRMKKILDGEEYKDINYDFTLVGLTKEKMFALLRKKRLEMELDLKSKEFDFISVWHDNLNRDNNRGSKELLKSSLEIAGNFLNLSKMLYISISEEEVTEDYNIDQLTQDNRAINVEWNNTEAKLSNKDIKDVVDYFYSGENVAFLTTRINPKFAHYSKLIDIFKEEEIICFVGLPILKKEKIQAIFITYGIIGQSGINNNDLIEDSKLDTLKIAFNQLVDTHKIYESQEQLTDALDEANAANKAKSDFLANMSHEIRTPLNSVLGMGEMILREAKEQDIIEYAANIKNSGSALLSIINDILDFSKIESGKMEIVPVEYEFSSLLYDLYNMLSPRAEKKYLKLFINAPTDMPYRVIGDDVRLRQIMTNILTNGIKYTKEGSVTLDVSWRNASDDSIFVKISITDTGIGIKKEDMGKLFESFQRLEIEKNRNVEGTGLGMGITVRLLEMMGSKLNVDSVYGEGSTFSFEIEQKLVSRTPMGDFKIKAEETIRRQNKMEKQHKGFTAPNAKVLVVDDNDMNRVVIKNLLKSTKIQVKTLESGYLCLQEVKNNKYDLIFLDHMMPDMDGIQTLEAFKLQPENLCRDVPVIVLTANAISGAREMYLKHGFSNYLSKPIDSKKLEKMIADYLPEKLIEYDIEQEEKNIAAANNGIITDDNEEEETPKVWDYITGLDMYEAMQHNPDKESFDQMIKMYYATIVAKADLIEKLEKEENIKDYTIQVHALKSSSRLVGATVVSELAARLEAEGNAENIQAIHSETGLLLSLYRKYREFLKPFVDNEEEAPKVEKSDDEIIEKLNLIKDAFAEFDLDSADNIIKELKEIEIPEAINEDFETLKEYVMNFKVEETPELIDNMVSKLG